MHLRIKHRRLCRARRRGGHRQPIVAAKPVQRRLRAWPPCTVGRPRVIPQRPQIGLCLADLGSAQTRCLHPAAGGTAGIGIQRQPLQIAERAGGRKAAAGLIGGGRLAGLSAGVAIHRPGVEAQLVEVALQRLRRLARRIHPRWRTAAVAAFGTVFLPAPGDAIDDRRRAQSQQRAFQLTVRLQGTRRQRQRQSDQDRGKTGLAGDPSHRRSARHGKRLSSVKAKNNCAENSSSGCHDEQKSPPAGSKRTDLGLGPIFLTDIKGAVAGHSPPKRPPARRGFAHRPLPDPPPQSGAIPSVPAMPAPTSQLRNASTSSRSRAPSRATRK